LDKCNVGKKGKESPNWKGGRSLDKHGYMRVYCPGHPRAEGNRVKEHILVWEQAHGKPLPQGWVIHHLNGIKTDNRIRNLIALPSMKHSLVLESKAKRIQELESALNGTSPLL